MPEPHQGLSEDSEGRPGDHPPVAAPVVVPFRTALAFWFRLGWISFGGPAGQIALMHQELVERRRWIGEARFLHGLNYCMLLPGPEAQQLATYIGWSLHGTRGGVAAGALFVLPSLFILMALSWLYAVHGQQPAVVAVLDGLKPAVVAVVAAAALRIGRRVLHHRLLVAIAAVAFVALAALNLPFPLVVLGAALVGAAAQRNWPQAFLGSGSGSGPRGPEPVAASSGASTALHGASPAPADAGLPHPRPGPGPRAKALWCLAVCIALWALSLGALAWAFGPSGTLVQMGWFFTQAALLTFGGAYAVLPFVMQAAVQQHGWLTAAQVMDGLALGETTPGPLIMVVAFVGFMGGWGQALFGPEQRLLAGVVAAVVVTWFTFLPSFLFILAGAPWVDRWQQSAGGRWSAALVAVTAAVVGVILNLALVFAQQVLWPTARGGAFDVQALALGLIAAWLLVRKGWGVVPVLGLCAACGAAAALIRA